MALLLSNLRKLCACSNLRGCSKKSSLALVSSFRISRKFYSIYEPPYINIKPEIEEYGELWLKLKAYDFSTLESYTRYAQKLLGRMEVQVTDVWPFPTMHSDLKIYKDRVDTQETQIDYSIKLPQYCRIIELQNVPNTWLPIMAEALLQQLPEGVDMEFQEPDEEEVEFRYIPDHIVESLKTELNLLNQLREERKKKKD